MTVSKRTNVGAACVAYTRTYRHGGGILTMTARAIASMRERETLAVHGGGVGVSRHEGRNINETHVLIQHTTLDIS